MLYTIILTGGDEFDGYRNELWRQEKLLNDAIYNMESALNVDAMLQQSTHSSTSLASTASQKCAPATASLPGNSSSSARSAYSYLRDLPLLIRTPMKLSTEDFKLHRSDHEKAAASELMPEGSMKLKIYCGHGLKTSRTTLRDLYCTIQLDNVKQAKTMIRTGAINFDWDETFDMMVVDGVSNLVCMIYDWDSRARHRLCFTGTVRLASVLDKFASGPQSCKCALKLEPRGIIYLEISYCRTEVQPVQSDCNTSFLFGRPLKEILATHQATETSVPLIVSKCIGEVESRGIGVTGIYRLCGAAKKKQQLRQEFEKHPHLVDVSPANVPEIHAITG